MPRSVLPGVSGLSLCVPPYRVHLGEWAKWVGAKPDKVEAVVGRSFRVCGPQQSVYTLAAGAVLDLIERYEVDPRDVGLLAFGTESSTDNAAGAVVIRGMLDEALQAKGLPALSRSCEVPEFKHACLGGVYGLKSAVRYLHSDGRNRRAIVVSADIAEYERGSTGEQTQGAGAVAMLLDAQPALFEVDLSHSGSASAYRGLDFRKPFARHFAEGYAVQTQRLHDFPVFNGKYSTLCYVDATVHAIDDMFARLGGSRQAFFDRLAGVVCHRPYQHMPQQAVAAAMVWSMARDPEGHAALRDLCRGADVDADKVLAQVEASPDLFEVVRREGIDADPYPDAMAAARAYRKAPEYQRFITDKMSFGDGIVRDLGNLYTAALPAWIGAAFEDAHARAVDLSEKTILSLGYGSGDAAEAIPLRVVPQWREAASKLAFAASLAGSVDLEQTQYEALHDGHPVELPPVADPSFVVERVGNRNEPDFADIGIEYYGYRAPH